MKMMQMTLDTLPSIAAQTIRETRSLKGKMATVITIQGDLGAGKTTLAQALARTLGIKESITSPTFVIMKKYKVIDKKFKHLIHIDAYRLERSEELEKLGWEEILKDTDNLILIEWPEHVPDCIPTNAYCILLSHRDEHTRTITLGN